MGKTAILDSKELKHFLAFVLLNPSQWHDVISFYINKVLSKVVLKFNKRFYFYPPYLKKFATLSESDIKASNKLAPEVNSLNRYKLPKINNIILAYGKLDPQNINDNWELEYDDIEQYWSLHRWGWLLILLTEYPQEFLPNIRLWGLEKIKDWLFKNMHQKQTWAWKDTYTVGERISNCIMFCIKSSTGKTLSKALPFWLEDPLVEHGKYVLRHLEYYNETGNHIINNARALYMVGSFFNKKNFREIAREIITNELTKLITPLGFLREGSFHYHFLFARWLLEIYWCAKETEDNLMVTFLTPILQRVVKACYFFLIWNHIKNLWEIPLIGDISPDFEPEWLLNLPWSKVALSCFKPKEIYTPPKQKGWGNLFGLKESRKFPVLHSAYRNVQFYKKDGWIRIDWGIFTLLWHIEPTGTPLFPNHAHCDTLSFCLYVKGFPVIVDPGRFNYCKEGLWEVRACSHNSITIDGLDPFPFNRKLPYCYSASNVKFHAEKENNDIFKLVISHNGFRRLYGDEVSHSRFFIVSPSQIIIEDKFIGQEAHEVQTFFHLYPEVVVTPYEDYSFLFKISNIVQSRNLNIRFKGEQKFLKAHVIAAEKNNRYGWYYPAYGRKMPTQAIIFLNKVKFPYSQRFILEIN